MEFIVGDVYFLSSGKGKDRKYYFSVLKAIDQPPYDLLFENGLCVTRNNLFSGEVRVLKHVASREEYMKNLDYDAFLKRVYFDLKQAFVDFYLAENEGCCCSNMISREFSDSLETRCEFEIEQESVAFSLTLFKDQLIVDMLIPVNAVPENYYNYERMFCIDTSKIIDLVPDICKSTSYREFTNTKLLKIYRRINDVISKLKEEGYWT